MFGLDGARCVDEGVGQAAGVEAPPHRAGISGLSSDNRSAQRLEPAERIIEALEDEPLQARVTVRALTPEVVE
jgi:hypothetical protein